MRKTVGRLIYDVVEGRIRAADAIDACSEYAAAGDASVSLAVHALYHYRDDEDIRQYDSAYGELQVRALLSMAERLVEGLPIRSDQGLW